MEYMITELENNSKYAIIDMILDQNKKYFLLAKILNDKISSQFDVVLYNEINNKFELIENEFEYNIIRDFFIKKLEEQKINDLNNIKVPKLIKLKVKEISGYNYKLEKTNGEIIVKNIEIYGNNKIEVNDNIYMLESTTEEKNQFQYGPLININNEIIKVINKDNEYYLQRYYG